MSEWIDGWMHERLKCGKCGKENENGCVLSRALETDSEDAEMHEVDGLFHVRAAETGNARSPTVKRRVPRTITDDETDDR